MPTATRTQFRGALFGSSPRPVSLRLCWRSGTWRQVFPHLPATLHARAVVISLLFGILGSGAGRAVLNWVTASKNGVGILVRYRISGRRPFPTHHGRLASAHEACQRVDREVVHINEHSLDTATQPRWLSASRVAARVAHDQPLDDHRGDNLAVDCGPPVPLIVWLLPDRCRPMGRRCHVVRPVIKP